MYQFDPSTHKVYLSNQALKLIEEFNAQENTEIKLLPEFGNWMVEAIPKEPYGAMEDIKQILSSYPKISKR